MVKDDEVRRRKNFSVTNNNPVDIHVGHRVRLRRNTLGLSQEDVAKHLGVTLQQVQKYERGLNRISASNLLILGRVLNVDVQFFFNGISRDTETRSPRAMKGRESEENYMDEYMELISRQGTVSLIRAFNKITDSRVRVSILDILKEIATEYSK